jgi:hypothetical protein
LYLIYIKLNRIAPQFVMWFSFTWRPYCNRIRRFRPYSFKFSQFFFYEIQIQIETNQARSYKLIFTFIYFRKMRSKQNKWIVHLVKICHLNGTNEIIVMIQNSGKCKKKNTNYNRYNMLSLPTHTEIKFYFCCLKMCKYLNLLIM